MEENKKEVIVEETPTQEIAAETNATIEEKSEDPKEEVKRDNSFHWEQARQALQLQKRQIEELKAQLETKNQVKVEQPEEVDEFADLDPEDYLTVKKAKDMATKLAAKEAAKTAKQIVSEYVQQQNVVQDEARVRSKYEDFDYVIENFAIPMIKNDPALAHKIQNSKNPAEVAYKLAKVSEEYEVEMSKQQQPTSPKAEKILKNTQRPLSSAAASTSLKSQADNFSKMTREEIWSLSQKYAKQA